MKKRKTVKKRYVIAMVIVIAGLITLWRILNAPVPTYQTLIVRPGDLQQSVLATGKLDALRKVDVGAQVSGQLKTLSVAIGDKVKKDQLLGVIDPEQAENQIKEVEATLMELRAQRQQAEAELKLARVTYSRQQRLAQTQAVSQQDLDNAATEMAVKNRRKLAPLTRKSSAIRPLSIRLKPISITPASLPRWPGKSRKSPLCKARR